MTRLTLTIALLFLLRCDGATTPPAPAAPRPASTASRGPLDTDPAGPEQVPEPRKTPEIVITGVTISNPIVVTGRARTFENAVSIRVRDAAGALIVEEHTTSAGEIGHHNPFEAQVWLTRDPGGRITVEAFEYSARDGSVRSMTRRALRYDVPPVRATLVFPTSDCTAFTTVVRSVPKATAMARLLVEALLAGPTGEERGAGATSAFPPEADVRAVRLVSGVLTVDFNERLRNVGGACAATAIRDSVTRTLQRLPTVKRVVLTAKGREDLALQP